MLPFDHPTRSRSANPLLLRRAAAGTLQVMLLPIPLSRPVAKVPGLLRHAAETGPSQNRIASDREQGRLAAPNARGGRAGRWRRSGGLARLEVDRTRKGVVFPWSPGRAGGTAER